MGRCRALCIGASSTLAVLGSIVTPSSLRGERGSPGAPQSQTIEKVQKQTRLAISIGGLGMSDLCLPKKANKHLPLCAYFFENVFAAIRRSKKIVVSRSQRKLLCPGGARCMVDAENSCFYKVRRFNTKPPENHFGVPSSCI